MHILYGDDIRVQFQYIEPYSSHFWYLSNLLKGLWGLNDQSWECFITALQLQKSMWTMAETFCMGWHRKQTLLDFCHDLGWGLVLNPYHPWTSKCKCKNCHLQEGKVSATHFALEWHQVFYRWSTQAKPNHMQQTRLQKVGWELVCMQPMPGMVQWSQV